jgi:cytochrome c biogenesis protein CcdA/thiol-disulfide isomerase/thioredoxin
MVLLILAFLGGILTIVSPCILPVLPFVFARSDQPFRKSGLPLLIGMALTFSAFAAVATTGGAWIVRANQYGRTASLFVLALFGLTLLWPALADRLSRPFVWLGARLTQPADSGSGAKTGASRSLLLGVATGLLWAPCAGPILGLILTGAALQGASSRSALLLVTYSAGAATSLAVALLAGGRVFSLLKRSLGAETWIRAILGIAVLTGVSVIALGLDRGWLTQVSLAGTSGIEQTLINRFNPRQPGATAAKTGNEEGVPETIPDLSGATMWLNSGPLSPEALKGHVVLVDFWTYSCINCLRTLPYVGAWAEKYKDKGLIVIGVHTPEFAFEKDPANVKRALNDLVISYPVALDNNYKIWEAFNNRYWPADYLIDVKGRIRHHHFGEGGYEESEREIQALLGERDGALSPSELVKVAGTGAEAASANDVKSPETYIGYDRTENFGSPGGLAQDIPHLYAAPTHLELNQWGLAGNWTNRAEVASLNSVPGRIVYRFHARDLHLVLGPATNGKPIRFRIRLDGHPPALNHGTDTDSQGAGKVTEHRLYQLIRLKGDIEDHTFEIEFLDPGVQAFAFTFG